MKGLGYMAKAQGAETRPSASDTLDGYDPADDGLKSYELAIAVKREKLLSERQCGMVRLELPFPVPLSACFTNAKGKGRVPTQRYKAWQHEAAWMIKLQKPRSFDGEVSICVRLVAPDKRIRDAGNCDKAILDAIVKARIIKDDSNRYVKRLTYEWAGSGKPCVVLVQNYEGSV